ncbi:unnamed protein product, partial [Prorocentrum cordatum]
KGVSRFSTERNKPLDSGSLLEVQGAKFGLRLQWGGADSDNGSEEVVALYAQLVQSTVSTPFWWRAQLRAIASDGKATPGPNAPEWLDAKKSSDAKLWGHPKWWKRADLLRSSCVSDDCLVLQLKVEAWPSAPRTEYCLPVGAFSEAPGVSLAVDLEELLRRGEGADVEVRAGAPDEEGSVKYPPLRAHRVVLAARSPVFRQMFFSAGMRESLDAHITLGDADPKAVQWFVGFLYSDNIADEVWQDDDAVCHLLALAHTYDVSALLKRCEARIGSRLSEENALERLMMADQYSISGLKEMVLQFIVKSKERLAKVQGSPDFARMGKNFPHLLGEIISAFVPPETKKRPVAAALPDDWESRTVVQLKQLCTDHGLHTSGTRDVLIQRLQQWRNSQG